MVCGVGWCGGYDQLCCPTSPKLKLGLDLGLGCDNDIRVLVKKVRKTCFGLRRFGV